MTTQEVEGGCKCDPDTLHDAMMKLARKGCKIYQVRSSLVAECHSSYSKK